VIWHIFLSPIEFSEKKGPLGPIQNKEPTICEYFEEIKKSPLSFSLVTDCCFFMKELAILCRKLINCEREIDINFLFLEITLT
jgi:hypothetical protein